MQKHSSLGVLSKTSFLRRARLPLSAGILALMQGCVTSPDAGEAAPDTSVGKRAQALEGPVEDAPIPPPPGVSPLKSAKLFVDSESLAQLTANRLQPDEPENAALIQKIASKPQAVWLGNWNSDILRSVDHLTSKAETQGAVPVFIAYNVPYRDCGQYSAGGLSGKEAYQRWIRAVHAGIADRAAVVVLEPDALGHFQECLTDEQKDERMALLSDAVRVLRQNPKIAVYLDAGHARWVPAEEMAERLSMAGVEHAHGFALNTSNYVRTEENLEYGHKLSELTGGRHFIIDTSRNGAGPYEEAKNVEETWCNPPGRKIGLAPTVETGDPLCDGFLWLKRPGESDGACGGGPVAGAFWTERAIELAE